MTMTFMPLLAPTNRMLYDTVQFYNGTIAIVAGIGVALLSFPLLPPLSPAYRTRRLVALTLRDLRRLARRPFRLVTPCLAPGHVRFCNLHACALCDRAHSRCALRLRWLMSMSKPAENPAITRAAEPAPARPAPGRRLRIFPILITLATIAVAVALGRAMCDPHMGAPWTRDGTVRVYVVTTAPEVAGRIVERGRGRPAR